jgi:Beta-lactamase enzyme family
MGGRTRIAPAAAAAALAFLAAGCSSPGTPITGASPTGDGFTHSKSPDAHPSRTKQPGQPKLPDPFKSLVSYLRSRQGIVTAALWNARTKQLWVYNRGVVEYTASIVKVEILGTALWEQSSGGPLPATQASLAQPMIEASDNNSASALLSAVGGTTKVAQFDQMAGLMDTSPHGTYPVIPGSPAPGWPGWGLTTTTAKDQVVLVRHFAYHNSLLTDQQRHYALGLMKNVEAGQNWGVSFGVPPGTTIALKNGWIPFPQALQYTAAAWQINSIGWIHGHGRNYVLAVLTRDNPTMLYGEDTIAHISRYVYSQLGA